MPATRDRLTHVRRGEWIPSRELAEFLEAPTMIVLVRAEEYGEPSLPVEKPKERMEIAVCAGCGRVRYKRVGRLCGHAGTCEEQGRLF